MGGVYRRAPMGARTTLTDAWPLFGLRLRSERLVLRLPTDDDLSDLMALARAGIHPPDEMPFGVAWSTLPSPAFERGFMQHHWAMRAAWSPERLVPQPAWSSSTATRSARSRSTPTDFAVHRTVAHRVVARAGRSRAAGSARRCARRCSASPSTGSGRAWPRPRPSSTTRRRTRVSRSLGYEANGFGSLAPEGVARETQRFRMTRRGLAVAAAAAAGDRGARRLPRACSGPDRRGRPSLEPAAGAAAAAARPPPPNPPPPPPPDDDGEFPIVPSADIIPPTSGMPESEKRLAAAAAGRRAHERRPARGLVPDREVGDRRRSSGPP